MTHSAQILPFKGDRKQPSAVVSGTPPNRKANDLLRTRNYLTEGEIDRLIKVAKKGRHGLRDRMMCGTIHVRRLKGSKDSKHFLEADELRGLRALRRAVTGPFVFVSQRGGPISPAGFRKQLQRWGVKAGIEFPVHPHQLRHAAGHALASRGLDTRSLQAFLGHASIANTVVYTQLSAERFRGIWK